MTSSSDLEPRLLAAIDAADTPEALEAVRLLALGKKGEITRALKALGGLEPDARREAGQALNRVKETVSQAIEARKARLAKARLEAQLESERVDSSQPIRPEARGALHPITRTIDEVVAIFGEMGFSWVEGPEVESDWYNFTALNMPADHAEQLCSPSGDWLERLVWAVGQQAVEDIAGASSAQTCVQRSPPVPTSSTAR